MGDFTLLADIDEGELYFDERLTSTGRAADLGADRHWLAPNSRQHRRGSTVASRS
jgi:hypothetical protein